MPTHAMCFDEHDGSCQQSSYLFLSSGIISLLIAEPKLQAPVPTHNRMLNFMMYQVVAMYPKPNALDDVRDL